MADYATAEPLLIVVMGPASCGKSTVGSNLAAALGIPFIDGDSLHPEANVGKMSAGIPLTDADRLPWLQTIRATAEKACAEQWASGDKTGLGRPSLVIACSSLRKYYRDILRGDVEVQNTQPPKLRTIFVYCKGTPELLEQRIAARKNHFMKPEMLASQLATLESPESEPGVAVVDISTSPEEVSAAALAGTRAIVAELEARGE